MVLHVHWLWAQILDSRSGSTLIRDVTLGTFCHVHAPDTSSVKRAATVLLKLNESHPTNTQSRGLARGKCPMLAATTQRRPHPHCPSWCPLL